MKAPFKDTRSLYQILSTFVFGICAASAFLVRDFELLGVTNTDILVLNGVLGWIVVLVHLLVWRQLSGSIVNLYSVFFTIYAIFNFGQSLLVAVGLDISTDRDLTLWAPIEQIITAQQFTLLGMCAFALGATWSSVSPQDHLKSEASQFDTGAMRSAVRSIGGWLILVSALPYALKIYTIVQRVVVGGYSALYDYQDQFADDVTLMSKIAVALAAYFVPGLICRYVGSTNHVERTLLSLVVLGLMAVHFYSGLRTAAIMLAIVLLIMHARLVSSRRRVPVVAAVFLGIGFLVLARLVGETRNEAGRVVLSSLSGFSDALLADNPLVAQLSEMGWSMYPLIAVMTLVPSRVDFSYGATYLWSLTSVVPNVGFWTVHPASLYADGPLWLMNMLGMLYGPGFSISAEAFRNFGWWGAAILFLFGRLFAFIYSHDNRLTALYRPDLFAAILILFSTTVAFLRGDFMGFVRPFAIVALPVFAAIHLRYQRTRSVG